MSFCVPKKIRRSSISLGTASFFSNSQAWRRACMFWYSLSRRHHQNDLLNKGGTRLQARPNTSPRLWGNFIFLNKRSWRKASQRFQYTYCCIIKTGIEVCYDKRPKPHIIDVDFFASVAGSSLTAALFRLS